MRKYEDETMELIEMVAENSHHNVTKPFRRGAMPKGQLIDAKSAKTGCYLKESKNGGSLKSTIGPTEHPQQFQRTRPRLHRRVPIAQDSITSNYIAS